jgi:hypothetical protein
MAAAAVAGVAAHGVVRMVRGHATHAPARPMPPADDPTNEEDER